MKEKRVSRDIRMRSYRKSEIIITPTLGSHEMGLGVLKENI